MSFEFAIISECASTHYIGMPQMKTSIFEIQISGFGNSIEVEIF